MADFLLYLEDEEFIYQAFIEPKWEQLITQDKWKEKFLETISSDDLQIIDENDNVILYGFKFFTNKNKDLFVKELEDKLFDGRSLDESIELVQYSGKMPV